MSVILDSLCCGCSWWVHLYQVQDW